MEQSVVEKTYLKDIYAQINVDGTTKEVVDFFDGYHTDRMNNDIHWLEILLEKLKNHSI